MEEKKLKDEIVERIILEATYYSQGKTTVAEAARRFLVSERTFQLDINERIYQAIPQKIVKLKKEIEQTTDTSKKKELEDEILRCRKLPFDLIRAKTQVTIKGNQKGGRIGKRSSSVDLSFLNFIADSLIEEFKYNETPISYSLRDLEAKYGISKSTLYEWFMKYLNNEKKEQIKSIFEYNNTIGKKRK